MEGSRAVGRRVVVTGLPGSGKSTLSIALAAKAELPLIHLDLEFWKPGWVAPSEDEWREKQRGVLSGDAWVADGNYHETLDLRLELADTVVVLDVPWWRCSGRALLRGLRMPGELPEGSTYTRWERLRDEWRLAVRIRGDSRTQPQHELDTIARHGSHVTLHVLRSKREVRQLLEGVDANAVQAEEG
jgi:adenylate kinase family enzyme